MVDLEGRVVAVNDRNAAGTPIETAWLYAKSYADAPWFKDALAGRTLDTEALKGTVVQDAHFDDDVRRVSGGDGYVVSLTGHYPGQSVTRRLLDEPVSEIVQCTEPIPTVVTTGPTTFACVKPSRNHFDGRTVTWRFRERRVARDYRRTKRLRQSNVHGVVRRHVLAQLPRSSQKIEMGVTVEVEVDEILDCLACTVR